MHHIKHNTLRPTTTLLALALLVCCLALAACGGSSASSTTSASASATSPTGASGPSGARGGRFTALRECLQKNGITLPKRTPGQGARPGGGFLGATGATQTLPSGVTAAQFQAALKKCGGGAGFASGRARFNSPAFHQSLAKFGACMRANGIPVPAPNTSGTGPVFNTKGLNPTSAQFRAAEAKCRSDLGSVIIRRGAGPGRPPEGAPPGSPGAGAGAGTTG